MSPAPLTFVCRRRTLDSILEGYFILNVVLGNIGRPLRIFAVEDNQPVPYVDNCLVLSLGEESVDYLREARRRGVRNLGLYHMGDELGTQDLGFYALADYVFRNYWFDHVFREPRALSRGVFWVPNGYRTGVGPSDPAAHLSIAQRWREGFFAGVVSGRTLSSEREEMVDVIERNALPFAVLTTPGFAQGLGPVAYASCLGSTRFALVPGGNSAETIRLYEALEAGAIPIMLRSPFVSAPEALNNPPFPILDSWQELPARYAPYAAAQSPQTIHRLEQERLTVARWWIEFKQAQQAKVKTAIDLAFAAAGEIGQAAGQHRQAPAARE